MPLIPYYRGRPAQEWIDAMGPKKRRNPADLPPRISDREKAAYQALARVVFAVPRAVTADVASMHDLGLSDLVALDYLSSAPRRQLRMTELAVACGASLSGISRIVDRLDRGGLTRRLRSPEDGRGTVAELTRAGQASLEQVYPQYLASIRRHILDHLSEVQLAGFTSSMERIADSLLTSDNFSGRSRIERA
jgi:DNA-binding MarR family transcriptional regulator